MEAFVIIFIIWIAISLLTRLLSSAGKAGSSKPTEKFLIRGGEEKQYKGALTDRIREDLLAYSGIKQVGEQGEAGSSVQILVAPEEASHYPELEEELETPIFEERPKPLRQKEKIEKPSPPSIPQRAALPKFNVSTLQQAIIMVEILGPPRARRQLRRL